MFLFVVGSARGAHDAIVEDVELEEKSAAAVAGAEGGAVGGTERGAVAGAHGDAVGRGK